MLKEVTNMFTVPLYTFEFKEHQIYKTPVLQYLGNDSLYTKYITPPHIKLSNPDLHKIPLLKPYYDFFMESLDYVMDDLGYAQKQSITSMWATQQRTNSFHHPHKHGNTFLAGVFYFHGSAHSSGTTFFNPDNTLMISPNQNIEKKLKLNALYQNKFVEGTFAVFPAWILHYTQANASSDIRYVLAVNSMPVGKIVDEIYDRYNYEDANNLELNMTEEEIVNFRKRFLPNG